MHLLLVFSMAFAQLESFPEGSCLSWGGCTDDYDEPVSALQVMLQVQERRKGPRAKLSTQEAPAKSEIIEPSDNKPRVDPSVDESTAGSDTLGPSFFQMEQETKRGAERSAKHRESVKDQEKASESDPAVMPSATAAMTKLREPVLTEHAEDASAVYIQHSGPLLTSYVSSKREAAFGIIAFCAAIYAFLWVGCRRHASKIWPEREQPKKQLQPANSPGHGFPSFKPPKLPDAVASFALPLVSLANCCVDAVSFNIPEASGTVMLRAVLSRLPPNTSWAKVEIFAGPETTPGASTLLASCCLAGSAADIEKEIVTGALQSWLSLLLHEKSESCEKTETSSDDIDETVPTVCADQVSEKEPAQSRCSDRSPQPFPRLEVKDGLGSVLGTLEPNAECRYSLWQHGQVAFEIESHLDDHWIALQKDGKDVALATGILRGGSPECTGEGPEEFLQVDVLSHAKSQDSVLKLICILIVTAQDASRKGEDVH